MASQPRSRKVLRAGEAGEDELENAVEQIDAFEAKRASAKGIKQASSSDPSSTQVEHVEKMSEVTSSPDMHSDRRLMGAAATVGGATGMLLMGPVTGVAMGAAALYAATREGSSGSIARKVGSMYLQVADRAMDGGLEAVDQGVKKINQAAEKGCQRLSKEVDLSLMPAPVRSGVEHMLSQAKSARSSGGMSEEARKIREKHPDKVPVICDRSPYATGLPDIEKKKFMVSGTMLCGEFKYMIHKHISKALAGDRSAEQTIYLFVNGLAPKTSTPMSELYEKLRADDGFLYIKYGAENTLG